MVRDEAWTLAVNAFASGLDHPRWIEVLPNGDVLVAESNSPPREGGGITGWVMGLLMSRAGAGVPSANRITLLRDANGDGVADHTQAHVASFLGATGEWITLAAPAGIAEACRKTSPPSSAAMKPKPFAASYHLTLPVGMQNPSWNRSNHQFRGSPVRPILGG